MASVGRQVFEYSVFREVAQCWAEDLAGALVGGVTRMRPLRGGGAECNSPAFTRGYRGHSGRSQLRKKHRLFGPVLF